jgi:hypothetical protein
MFKKIGRPAFYFDAPADGGTGGGTGTPPATPPATSTATPPAGTPPNATGNGGPTQEELDRQFADRANRAAEAERKKFYEALGVKDETEYQAFLKAKKDADDKIKSDIQKAQDDLTKAKGDLTTKDTTIADLQKRLVDSEIKQAAARQIKDKDGKVTRPSVRAEALERVPALIDRSKISEKDGKTLGIEEALVELAKTDAYLFEASATTPPGKGTPIPPAGQKPIPPVTPPVDNSPKIAL